MATDHIIDRQFYFDGLAEEQLLIQHCSSCGATRFPATPICSACKSREWKAVPSKGVGTIYSYIVMHRPKMADHIPPIAAVVELEEDVLLVSSIVGVEPENVDFDMPVQLEFAKTPDGENLHVFRPVSG